MEPKLLPNRLGTSILWSIFYVPAHLFQSFTNFLNITHFKLDGWNYIYQTSATFCSIILGFIGLIFNFKILTRFFSIKISYISCLLGFTGTTAFTYVFLSPSFSHAADFFIVSLFTFYLIKTINNRKNINYFILGLILLFVGITREQSLFFGIFIIADIIYQFIKSPNINKLF